MNIQITSSSAYERRGWMSEIERERERKKWCEEEFYLKII